MIDGLSDDDNVDIGDPRCRGCGGAFNRRRRSLGYYTCITCGEIEAKKVKHTVVPMPKSNYILVTDMSLLKGLNSSHKGGR